MTKQLYEIFDKMTSDDTSPIIIRSKELFEEFKNNLPILIEAYKNTLPVEMRDKKDRSLLASDWIKRKQRFVFPIFDKTDLCIYRTTIIKYYAYESYHVLKAKEKKEIVENANICLKSEIDSLEEIESGLSSEKMNLTQNTPLIKNVAYYKQICIAKIKENEDEVTIKETKLDKSLFRSKQAIRSFLEIERIIFERGFIDRLHKLPKI